jgi:menaquinone-9 beta-reductase
MRQDDILIVGAGPAGCATALHLARSGVPCTLVDKHLFPRDKVCGDALSGKVVEVLRRLDIDMSALVRHDGAFLGSHGVSFIAPDGNTLRVPFKQHTDMSAPAPGYIARRTDFDHWLIQQVKRYDSIQLLEEVEIRHYTPTSTGYTAHTRKGIDIPARIIIAADGAYSTFAKDMARLVTEPAHNCFGIRAYYQGVSQLDAQNFIELHFINELLPGYFWIFPLPGGYANVGAGIRADVAHTKKLNLKKEFEQLIKTHPVLAPRFANSTMQGEVKLYGLPLGSKKRKLSGNHYMLTGDAAMLIDPFTGEGIGNAMMSGLLAAEQAIHSITHADYSAGAMARYDEAVYHRLWSELKLSRRMQQLVNYPWLFNLVVRRANKNKALGELISCMFEDIALREKLKDPMFYAKLLFS